MSAARARVQRWNTLVVVAAIGWLGMASPAAPADGHVVRGVVHRDPFCDPAAAITVALQPGERVTPAAADGAFQFDGVADGDYEISAASACQPSEYAPDAIFVRGTDAYSELFPSRCPQRVVVTMLGDGRVHIVGRCYYIHSGATANLYLDDQFVGTVSGDTPGNYEATIDATGAAPGRHVILVAVPGPILGTFVGLGVFSLDETPCPGDCDGDGRVAVAELIAGVRLALGEAGGACAAFDSDGDAAVDVGELVAASAALLDGCQAP